MWCPTKQDFCGQTEATEQVLLALDNDDGVAPLFVELFEFLNSETTVKRRTAAALIAAFCNGTTLNFSDHVSDLLHRLILLFNDPDEVVSNLFSFAIAIFA